MSTSSGEAHGCVLLRLGEFFILTPILLVEGLPPVVETAAFLPHCAACEASSPTPLTTTIQRCRYAPRPHPHPVLPQDPPRCFSSGKRECSQAYARRMTLSESRGTYVTQRPSPWVRHPLARHITRWRPLPRTASWGTHLPIQ
jgi:hypothetical protein